MLLYESRRNYKKPGQIEIQDLLKRVSTVRIRPGAPEEYRARYRYGAGLFWSKGRIRTVDTRVTYFPVGGVFESARGHQKIMTASREWRRFWFVGPPADSDRRHPRHSFPRGGGFRFRPGAPEEYRARYRYGAGLFWFRPYQKQSARLLGEQAGACERICLRRKP